MTHSTAVSTAAATFPQRSRRWFLASALAASAAAMSLPMSVSAAEPVVLLNAASDALPGGAEVKEGEDMCKRQSRHDDRLGPPS